MAYEQTAADLAACFYAASLIPDPTLSPEPSSAGLAALYQQGRELSATLLDPERLVKIRCTCGTRTTQPDRPSRVLATVHDKRLVVTQGQRGAVIDGLRLTVHHIIDIGLARAEGFKSVSVWCYGCGALHDLGVRWLAKARRNEVSTPAEQYRLAGWGDPIAPQGYTPRHPNDADRLAFAILTGTHLDSPDAIVTLGTLHAFAYRDHFGFQPPHDEHLFRLVSAGDERIADPRIQLLAPQWWRIKHGLDDSGLEPFEGPLTAEQLQEFAQMLRADETHGREDSLLTFQQLMDPSDFDQLTALVTQEAQ